MPLWRSSQKELKTGAVDTEAQVRDAAPRFGVDVYLYVLELFRFVYECVLVIAGARE